MDNTRSFDHQLADLTWMISTALLAGYSLREVLEQLVTVAPEPTASACAALQTEINSGVPIDQAVMRWQQSVPSKYLPEVAAVIHAQQQSGGNLAFMLEPIGDAIFDKAGSDGAFYPAMRVLADCVGAPLADRAK